MSKSQALSDADIHLAHDIRRKIEGGEIDMQPVESTNLRRAGYWHDEQILVLDFPSGTYAYLGLPPNVNRKLMEAKSKGSFFLREIRDCYPTIRIPVTLPEREQPAHDLAAHA